MSNRKAGPTTKLLIEARTYFDDKENWVQGNVRKRSGHLWWARTRYCAVGYVQFNAKTHEVKNEAYGYLLKAAHELYPMVGGAMCVNDDLGYEATMKMFDRAIQLSLAHGD